MDDDDGRLRASSFMEIDVCVSILPPHSVFISCAYTYIFTTISIEARPLMLQHMLLLLWWNNYLKNGFN